MNKIEIKNLDLFYGSFHALKKINLEIPEHQITAFIGPSGCGKSTLLKSINRMNDLVEGCKIDGEILIRNGWKVSSYGRTSLRPILSSGDSLPPGSHFIAHTPPSAGTPRNAPMV